MMQFKDLHVQYTPLLLCNVWDAASAQVAEKLGFQAIGTSSAAIAAMLGDEDGENIGFSELLNIVAKIKASTELPLTVDLESGYGRDPIQIAENISQLVNLGVVGINIEDSIVQTERTLIDATVFKEKLQSINQWLNDKGIGVFINVRTDTFLLGVEHPVQETLSRIKLFESTGVDGIFVPCIEKESDIEIITSSTNLPVNVMCMPNLPDFEKLKALGVKRISMGNFLFDKMYRQFENTLDSVVKHQSFEPVF